jgi:CRISPR-associated endonuclease Cas1
MRRFPRVGHGIRRIVIVGSDGVISLSALRWLHDQDAGLVMLERDGSVIASVGPAATGDARLRRAQSLAIHSGLAVEISRELIGRKLIGQAKVSRELIRETGVCEEIQRHQSSLDSAKSLEHIRLIESQAANAYWAAWRKIPVHFPERELKRVPTHWLSFGARRSPISGSPRLAVNPLNAMLNYLYAVLESESRLALATLGLDPAIGFLHKDAPARDSLACDLMEAVRPEIDAYLIDWIRREPLRRSWFFEEGNGNCRLMGSFAVRLSQSAESWARAIAPVAELVARMLWSRRRNKSSAIPPPTRLTQNRRREVKGGSVSEIHDIQPHVPRICRVCGKDLERGLKYCGKCAAGIASENLKIAAQAGRVVTHGSLAQSRRAETMRRQQNANLSWSPKDLPDWLSDELFRQRVQPGLLHISVHKIATTLRVSEPYATQIRRGVRTPHRRHWLALSELTRVLPS